MDCSIAIKLPYTENNLNNVTSEGGEKHLSLFYFYMV